MRETVGWCETKYNNEKKYEGMCKDRVLTRAEVVEELGPGYNVD